MMTGNIAIAMMTVSTETGMMIASIVATMMTMTMMSIALDIGMMIENIVVVMMMTMMNTVIAIVTKIESIVIPMMTMTMMSVILDTAIATMMMMMIKTLGLQQKTTAHQHVLTRQQTLCRLNILLK
jgi:hypothetical protein